MDLQPGQLLPIIIILGVIGWVVWPQRKQPKQEQAQTRHLPPALRVIARVELEPARSWRQLIDDDEWGALFAKLDALLTGLKAEGIDLGDLRGHEGGFVTGNSPYVFEFLPLDEGGWLATLHHTGPYGIVDDAATRGALTALDAGLRKMPGVTTVGWYKRWPAEGPPAAGPIES